MFSFQIILTYLFTVGAISFIWNKGYLLSSLISLEYMALMVFSSISLYLMTTDYFLLSILFLTVSVCEGALGLSILVVYARSKGSDYMSNSTLTTW